MPGGGRDERPPKSHSPARSEPIRRWPMCRGGQGEFRGSQTLTRESMFLELRGLQELVVIVGGGQLWRNGSCPRQISWLLAVNSLCLDKLANVTGHGSNSISDFLFPRRRNPLPCRRRDMKQ